MQYQVMLQETRNLREKKGTYEGLKGENVREKLCNYYNKKLNKCNIWISF